MADGSICWCDGGGKCTQGRRGNHSSGHPWWCPVEWPDGGWLSRNVLSRFQCRDSDFNRSARRRPIHAPDPAKWLDEQYRKARSDLLPLPAERTIARMEAECRMTAFAARIFVAEACARRRYLDKEGRWQVTRPKYICRSDGMIVARMDLPEGDPVRVAEERLRATDYAVPESEEDRRERVANWLAQQRQLREIAELEGDQAAFDAAAQMKGF